MGSSELVAAAARRLLPLSAVELGDEYSYQSLTLCVIDAVYSIGVRYEGVRRVVSRYCDKTGQPRLRQDRTRLPDQCEQESIASLYARFESLGVERMTADYFVNRQRTSTASGILKSEAVYRFALALQDFDVNYFQDIPAIATNAHFEKTIREIPGQRSGISLRYFWMLAGSDDFVKPDRMVFRFLQSALGRGVAFDEATLLLREAAAELKRSYPVMTPRLLDHAIWLYQRQVSTERP